MIGPSIPNLSRLLKLRLIVARFGEMDCAKWWNTTGQLGRDGTFVLSRGFPRTHYFAQARAVFAVAAHRCAERFQLSGSITLWRLPENIEAEFDARWEHWLDHPDELSAFFQALETQSSRDLLAVLRASGLVSEKAIKATATLKRSMDNRAVLLSGTFAPDDECLAMLALGFSRGDVGELAVPYYRSGGE